MKIFLIYGAIRLWHDCVVAVEAENEQEAREKACRLEYQWMDVDPPSSIKEVDLDITGVEGGEEGDG